VVQHGPQYFAHMVQTICEAMCIRFDPYSVIAILPSPPTTSYIISSLYTQNTPLILFIQQNT
jgi:hypothetical protein